MGNRYMRPNRNDRTKQTETPVIKNYNNIRKETIKTTNFGDSKYYLTFNFSWTYDWIITVYLCWNESTSTDPEDVPIIFHTTDNATDNPISFKFSSGTRQSFPENAWIIDINKFKEEDLCYS